MGVISLYEVTPMELAAALTTPALACTEAEARRLLAWCVSHGRTDFTNMRRPVKRALRTRLAEVAHAERPRVLERIEDPVDDAVRYLFQAADGALFEAVRIGLDKDAHYTVCLSSQAGCAMGCTFCATGRLGLRRHLAAAEIVASFCTVRDEAPGRVSGAVFMGQGEPFHNYEAVLRAAGVLAHSCGGRISAKAITMSTVGLVPQILRFTAEAQPYKLIVSLSSALPERRRQLLPVAARWSLPELAAAVASHAEARGRPATLAWVLMGGVNHDQAEAEALATLFDGVPVRINLIDINDRRPDGQRRATDAERNAFHDALSARGLPVIRRYSVGRSRDAACGMLASRRSATLSGVA